MHAGKFMSHVITARRPQPAWGASTAIEDRFRPLVAELEVLAAAKPDAYRGRVFRRAWLGYGYIALILSLIAVVIAALVALVVLGHGVNVLVVKFGFFLAIAAFYILRSLWVKVSPPEGVRVTLAEAPELFAMLDAIRRRTGGPEPDRVIITPDFNAAIVQHPRLGMFGWHRNYIVLGLPLLLALPRDEVMAVIGHEYGHLAGAHGKMTAWIYRVRMTWLRLSASFGHSIVGGLFQDFFKWYGPWFNAYSFVLARNNEYAADRAAADVGGAEVAARALTRVSIETHRYQRFWANLFEKAAAEGDDRVFPHARMGAHFVQPMEPLDLRRALNTALNDATDINDTHPCLKDRLAALGQALPELQPIERRGADDLLGPAMLVRLSEALDGDWWQRAGSAWTRHRAEALTARQALSEMDTKASHGELDEDDDWEHQRLIEACGQDERALDKARARTVTRPDEVAAHLCLGRLLLERGDAEGLASLQVVLEGERLRQPQLVALSHIVSYFDAYAPDSSEREAYRWRFDEALVWYNQLTAELDQLDEDIVLEPHAIPLQGVDAIRERARPLKALKRVWIGVRRLKRDPDTTQFVMLYEWLGDATPATNAFVADVMQMLRRHGNAFAVRATPGTAWLKSRLETLDGGRVVG